MKRTTWLIVPVLYGVVLGVLVVLRWLPTYVHLVQSAERAGAFGRAIGGNIVLLAMCAMRVVVAFVVTVPAMLVLPPVSVKRAAIVSIIAAILEISAELVVASLDYKPSGLAPLFATLGSYGTALTIGALAFQRTDNRPAAGHPAEPIGDTETLK